MIKSGGGKIMGDRGWWQQNYGWLWAVVNGGDKIMGGRGWSHDLVNYKSSFFVLCFDMYYFLKIFLFLIMVIIIFYFDICIKSTLSTIISTIKK